jgi:hypothetical protein
MGINAKAPARRKEAYARQSQRGRSDVEQTSHPAGGVAEELESFTDCRAADLRGLIRLGPGEFELKRREPPEHEQRWHLYQNPAA